jgi:hypothetical protein
VFAFSYLTDGPLLGATELPRLGGNINGPSLIRCPGWVRNPPARYLLYFAHHEGRSIRLALSDRLQGPWRIHDPAPLVLEDSLFALREPRMRDLDPEARNFVERNEDGLYPHLASPDAWIDDDNRQIRLYYHGRLPNGLQRTRVALSPDGLHFTAREEIIATSYLRLFRHDGWYYAITMPAQLYRSRDGLGGFEAGPRLTAEPIRHHALLFDDARWYFLWTRVGDSPERILVSTLETGPDWRRWRLGKTAELHQAQRDWEGADMPAEPSRYGAIMQRANQLRDPAVYSEGGRHYLLYAIAGEQGIAIGELTKTWPV